MCWDPICTVAEVWCCSEHYSGFLTVISWWRHRLQCIVVWQSFLRLLKLDKLEVGKPDLLRGGLTCCHGVLDHGLNLHPNIPLKGLITKCSRVPQLKDEKVWLLLHGNAIEVHMCLAYQFKTIIIESWQGKEQNWAFLTKLVNRLIRASPQRESCRRVRIVFTFQ